MIHQNPKLVDLVHTPHPTPQRIIEVEYSLNSDPYGFALKTSTSLPPRPLDPP